MAAAFSCGGPAATAAAAQQQLQHTLTLASDCRDDEKYSISFSHAVRKLIPITATRLARPPPSPPPTLRQVFDCLPCESSRGQPSRWLASPKICCSTNRGPLGKPWWSEKVCWSFSWLSSWYCSGGGVQWRRPGSSSSSSSAAATTALPDFSK